jgi:kynurenine formamidase
MERYDLSQPLETGMPVYPGTPPVSVEQRATIEDVGARITHLDIGSHTGTHIDAPSHILPDGATLDAYDLSSFVFETRLADCREKGDREAITRADLPAVEESVEMLVLRTGWDEHWGTDRYRDHPYLDAGAAAWCADRGLAVGIDAFSPDPTPSVDRDRHGADEPPDGKYPVHDAVLGAELRIIENLTNIEHLPERFTLEAYPLSVPGCDGSPIRAVGLVE